MYFTNFNLQEIIVYVESLGLKKTEGILIMTTEHTPFDFDELVMEFGKKKWEFFGGIFPAILNGKHKFERGVVIKKIAIDAAPLVIEGLNEEKFKLSEIEQYSPKAKSVLVLIDGLTANISSFLSELFNTLGDGLNYIGGGCGSLTLQQRPNIFTNKGFFQDAALLVFLPQPISLGVRHGWKTIQGPFVASSAHKNVVKELNWQSAFEIYQSVIESDSQQTIGVDNFFEIAKAYPLGINKENKEKIVRDPIATNEKGELFCVGEVPENAVLSILKGKPQNLIAAAKQATKDAIESMSGTSTDVLVIECISRSLYLEKDFEHELDEINENVKKYNPDLQIQGALTLGEIASGRGYIEFYNKTVVVGLIH
ncbi:FIST N-terminal domain-containing protein [Flammeovirgaceae bacterium SG7u.111]|nr:FIST N-terminal domain-containing protein [Flammeovirgaceae bacterium SG7u.132]WPO34549.1 FIST N-terminal domain-containing protein [Flammeovirgaceae bacterium SG7u.111]